MQSLETLPGAARRTLRLSDINGTDLGSQQQREVVIVFLKICGLWKENGIYLPPRRRDDTYGHILLSPGPAGTGKSYVIDVLVTEIIERYCDKNGILDYMSVNVQLVAPTGKAALNIGGSTINASSSLGVPVDNLENYGKNHYKDGRPLLRLQERLSKTIAIIIDEFSMLSSTQLFWASDRVQQGVVKYEYEKPFGGVPIIIIGDPGQLFPVGGSPLWQGLTSSNRPLKSLAYRGHQIYKMITTVMFLTQVRRQDGIFRDILLRLRDGKITKEDWELINNVCSIEGMTAERLQSFEQEDCTYILSTNESCNNKNFEKHKGLNKPIVLIEAEHDNQVTKSKSTESCRRLQSQLYLSINSRVMLLWNLSITAGLVNGSIGKVVNFVYTTSMETNKPPQLPTFIIIEFPCYCGSPFFQGTTRTKWVPLFPSTYEFEDYDGTKRFRKQYPLQCAWALTTWKAQGMTCENKVFSEIREKERSNGLTYVQLSRCTRMDNLCIGRAVSFERLSLDISKTQSLRKRLVEEERLVSLWNDTRAFYNLT